MKLSPVCGALTAVFALTCGACFIGMAITRSDFNKSIKKWQEEKLLGHIVDENLLNHNEEVDADRLQLAGEVSGGIAAFFGILTVLTCFVERCKHKAERPQIIRPYLQGQDPRALELVVTRQREASHPANGG